MLHPSYIFSTDTRSKKIKGATNMIHERTLYLALIAAICATLAATGCARRQHAQVAPIANTATVGVFVADYSGGALSGTNEPGSTFAKAHLYQAFWQADFATVALNDLDVTELVGDPEVGDKSSLLTSLQGHFREMHLDYLAIVFVKTYNIRDYLAKTVLVDVETMRVVAVDIAEEKPVTVGCASTWWLGVPMLVCPFLAIHNDELREIEVLSEALARMGRATAQQATPR
ncbi:MAG: hypothetical protein R6V85_19510 [Polyangia bacterium]